MLRMVGIVIVGQPHHFTLFSAASRHRRTRMVSSLITTAVLTSASQSLGAINLKTNKASEIIRSYYGRVTIRQTCPGCPELQRDRPRRGVAGAQVSTPR